MNPGKALLTTVRRTRRRALWLGCVRTLLAGLTGLGAGPLASAAVLPWVPEAGRPWVAAGFLILAAALGIALATAEWRKARPRLTLAEAAGVLAGPDDSLRDLVLTGADIAAWEEEGARERGASPELALAQVEQAARAARGMDVTRALPATAAAPRAAWAGVMAVLVIAWLALNPGGSVGAWGTLFSGGVPEPVTVGNLRLSYVPPAYTGIPERGVEGSDGSVEGYPGTRVTLDGEVSRPVDRGEWKGPSGVRVPLRVEGNEFFVSWILDRPGSYSLGFRRGSKEVPSDFVSRPIVILEDARPGVKLTAPERDLEVTTDQEVEVAFDASDDFRVERAELVLQGEQEVRIRVPITPERRLEATARFLPLVYPELGEGAHLRVDAWDGDTVAGPKVGTSRSVYVAFLDKRRLMAEVEGLEERLLEALLHYLADHLETEAPNAEELGHLRAKGQDLLRLFQQLVERVRQAAEEGALGALAVLRMEESLRAAVEPFLGGAEERVGLVAELERDILFLDRLLRSLRMEEVLSMGDELAALQRSLFDDLQAGATPEELQARIEQIEDLLSRMAEKMANAATEMPDAFANADAVQNMPSSDLRDALEQLRQALQQGDMEAARKLAEGLLETLSRWMAALEEAAQGASQAEMDPVLKELLELEEQVSDLSAEQERILQETRAMGEEVSNRVAQGVQEQIESFLERQERRLQVIDESSRRMESLAHKGVFDGAGLLHGKTDGERWPVGTPFLRLFEARQSVGSGVSEVRDALREDLGRARQEAVALGEALETLKQGVMGGLRPEDSRRQAAERYAEVAERELEGLLRDLDALAGRRLEGLTPQELESLRGLSAREEELGERTGSLAERLQELARQMPMLEPGLPRNARSAQEAMGEAGQRLGEGNPFEAASPETRALEELAEISRNLRDSRQQMMEGMGGSIFQVVRLPHGRGGGGGLDVDRGPVEIPKEMEARELKAFREEVLRAMRSGQYPRDYEEEVEQYYERLIR